MEKNKSSSLEIKCTIARIEVDYSSWNLIYLQAVKKSNLTCEILVCEQALGRGVWGFVGGKGVGEGAKAPFPPPPPPPPPRKKKPNPAPESLLAG